MKKIKHTILRVRHTGFLNNQQSCNAAKTIEIWFRSVYEN